MIVRVGFVHLPCHCHPFEVGVNDAFAFLASWPLSGVAGSWRVIPPSYLQVVDAGLDAVAALVQYTEKNLVHAVATSASFSGDIRWLLLRDQIVKY